MKQARKKHGAAFNVFRTSLFFLRVSNKVMFILARAEALKPFSSNKLCREKAGPLETNL